MESATRLSHIKPADLPAPPKECLRIVQACSVEQTNSRQLGEMIAHDPLFTAELLRVTNSPFFGFRSQVKTAAHAVSLIGQRALRNMALCIAMKDALRPEAIPGLELDRFWEAALRRAVCARSLAAAAGLDAEECFTAGLIQDVGLLVLLFIHQERVSEWPRLAAANPDERLELERNLFQLTHDQAGLELARNWELPEELVLAIGHHHSPVMGGVAVEQRGLITVARCADWMAGVFSAGDKRLVFTRCGKLLEDGFGLDQSAVDELLDTVGENMVEAARAFGFHIEQQTSLDEVLRDANLRLAEDNLSFQELTWKLEHALAERDEIAAELNRELSLAREVQCSLLPRDSGQGQTIHGINVSAREVSGDFYDYFPSRNGLRYFAIADVSGKGMNAALLMAKASSLLHCLGKGITDPATLMAMVNREICEKAVRGMFVTMAVGVYDPQTGQGRLVNAGHLPVLQFTPQGHFQAFAAGAPPLGVLADTRFSITEFDLNQGELYLYTDGLIEARRNDGTELEIQGLQQLIRDSRELSGQRRVQHIVAQVQSAAERIRDDLTLLVVDLAPDD